MSPLYTNIDREGFRPSSVGTTSLKIDSTDKNYLLINQFPDGPVAVQDNNIEREKCMEIDCYGNHVISCSLQLVTLLWL